MRKIYLLSIMPPLVSCILEVECRALALVDIELLCGM